MKTDHIHNVALYAKNFYKHTGDVVKDMQAMLQLDGHCYAEISTPEDVASVMKADYAKFVNSIEDEHSREFLLKDIDRGVSWAEGPESHIWIYLVTYSNAYVPMHSKYIGYPKYDESHLPEYNVKDINFKKCMSFAAMRDAAKNILDKTQEDEYDLYMNRMLRNIDWDNVLELLSVTKENGLTKEALKDELWEAYENYMDDALLDDHTLEQEYKSVKTKHFNIAFNPKNEAVYIDVDLVIYKQHYEVNMNDGNYSDDFKQLINDNAGNMKSVELANAANEAAGHDEFFDLATTMEGTLHCHASIAEDINLNNGVDCGIGSHTYSTYRTECEYNLDVYLVANIGCEIKEMRLWPTKHNLYFL